jgi:hypothetical protein
MLFFTRAMYQAMQEDDADIADRWRRTCDAYREHHDRVRPSLPPRMRAFAETTLHDGVVRGVTRPESSVLVLDVDATHNPWGPRGIFRLTFTGVRAVEGIEQLVGDNWVYEEVHLDPEGGFDFRVLFDATDFRVVATEVEVQDVSSGRTEAN